MYKAYYDCMTGESTIVEMTEEELQELRDSCKEEITEEQQKRNRAASYREESDPIYFKIQRGEATMEEWLSKIEEIKQRFPYPS